MNFAGFVSSLGLMGKGMLIIFGVMLVVWGVIEVIRACTKDKAEKAE